MSDEGVSLRCKYELIIAAFRDLGEQVKTLQAKVERLEKELKEVRGER